MVILRPGKTAAHEAHAVHSGLEKEIFGMFGGLGIEGDAKVKIARRRGSGSGSIRSNPTDQNQQQKNEDAELRAQSRTFHGFAKAAKFAMRCRFWKAGLNFSRNVSVILSLSKNQLPYDVQHHQKTAKSPGADPSTSSS
jgi:hypothetical protein